MFPGARSKSTSDCCLIHSRGLYGLLPVSAMGSSLHGGQALEKPSQGDGGAGAQPSHGGLIKTLSVSRMQLYFLHTPQPNFLWISDHLLFPITLLFTLSIWRIQMLNDKKERRMGGGRRIPFCLKDKILEMPPRTASPKRSSTWQRLAQLSLCQMIIWELNLISIILPRHISIKSAIRVLTHLWTCYFFG